MKQIFLKNGDSHIASDALADEFEAMKQENKKLKKLKETALRCYAEQQIKELREALEKVKNDLDKKADWGGGGNWLTNIIQYIEQALKK